MNKIISILVATSFYGGNKQKPDELKGLSFQERVAFTLYV
jgi:hypothetical protein